MAALSRQAPRLSTNFMVSGSRRAVSTSTEDQQQQQQPQDQTPPPPPSTTSIRTGEAIPTTEAKATLPSLRHYPYTLRTGTVASVGKMDRTVRVAHHHSIWDSYLRKTFPKVTSYLVADPHNSLRERDVVEFSSGYPKSRRVHHVVERIIAPFGSRIDERPAVMSREERDTVREQKRAAKWLRREQRRVESGVQGAAGVKEEHMGRIRTLVLERKAAK